MKDPLVVRLQRECRGEVVAGASLAEFTTLRVGGRARVLVVADRDGDLAAVGRACAEEGVGHLVVGRGSNLLVSDRGWPGVALQLGRGFRGVEVPAPTGGTRVAPGPVTVRAGAAEPLPSLAVRLADAGLAGFAWASAVPGTLGGAVRMNAGAHGAELADHLAEVELVRLSSGTRETWPAGLLELAYRRSELPSDAVVVAATLRFERGTPAALRAEIDEIRAWRRRHQPLNEPNCGSVFTNPPGDAAGRLVEATGLKGQRIGGAAISERHANFIVTRPGACAADVFALIELVRARVAATQGIDLVPELTLVGDFGPPPEGAS